VGEPPHLIYGDIVLQANPPDHDKIGDSIDESQYGTNRTATGYNRTEMDEKYCKEAAKPLEASQECYKIVHKSINC
jgi:hypothetical protein